MVKVQRLFAKTNLKLPVYPTRSQQGLGQTLSNKSTYVIETATGKHINIEVDAASKVLPCCAGLDSTKPLSVFARKGAYFILYAYLHHWANSSSVHLT